MSITIDGKVCFFNPGATVLEVARQSGIKIPSLCYHPRIGALGRCRICLVEVEGQKGLQTACTLAARDGMLVSTSTPQVLEARRMVVNLLLSKGEHDCLSCERSGQCELQDVASQLGIEKPAFAVDGPEAEVDGSSEMIAIDRHECILCGRCVEACNNVVVNEVLGIGGRAAESKVICDADRLMTDATCVQCGECSQVCPVGAIRDKKSTGKGRLADLTRVNTTCAYCGVGCQLTLHVHSAQNRIVRVTGREVAPNDGMLCVKGRYGYEFPSSPKRITQPMIMKNGKHEPVSWGEALDFAAARIRDIVTRDGPNVFSAFGSGRITNENNYAIAKFTRAVIKTNNIDHCART